MIRFFAKYKLFAIVLSILSAIIISIIYSILKPNRVLPVYNPEQIDVSLVDSTIQEVRKYHTIADFSLQNQNGETVTQQDYRDKIYVADFFFTTCQTICPIMTDHMLQIQEALRDDQEVLLLSHTVIPKTDTVAQLKRYANKKGVWDEKWNLVTGEKKELYDLARKSYLVAKNDGDGGPYDMIHTENFVLVDKKRRIRGFYDGTNAAAIQELLADIKVLQSEN